MSETKIILLVEDEAPIAIAEKKILEKRGYGVITAHSGKKAIEKLRAIPDIDLILMDINLGTGKMDGIECAEIILKERDIPVLFLLSHTEPEFVEKTEKITSYGYVVKDSAETVLNASIEMALKLHKARQETKENEHSLSKTNERLDLAQQIAGVGIWDWYIVGNSIEWTPQMFELFGLDKDKTAASFEAWWSILHPEDREKAEFEIERALKDHVFLSNEYRIVRPDGQVRWISAMGQGIYDTHGRPVRMAGTCIDITDRKHAENALRENEAQLKSILRVAPVGIGTVVDRVINQANDMLCAMTGYAQDELQGQNAKLLYPTQDDFEFVGREKYAQIADHGTGAVETRWVRKDGTIIDVLLSSTPLDLNDLQKGVTFIALDITKRKRAEESLRLAHDELEKRVRERTAELNKAYEELQRGMHERESLEYKLRQSQKMEAIGTLAGGIAHDFNNILAAILGFTEMAIDDASDGRSVDKSLQNVLKSTFRARELVSKILSFSRKTNYDRTPISLSPLVIETIQLLRASIPAIIEIKLSITARSDTVLAAPTEVQQILMNLATNASLAMEEKGGILDISLNDIDFMPRLSEVVTDLMPGEYVQLTVKDTGVGMGHDVMERIFEPFFTTRKLGAGTGMGLAVVYGIVADLQGAITVQSEPGVGTVFQIFLPKIKAKAKKPLMKRTHISEGTESILFIDDEVMLVEWAKATLERLGYRATTETDPAEALKILASDPSLFDLVITDQSMPSMSGIQLARKILAIRPDIPIILCTGHSATVSPERTREAGIKEFLRKPIAREEFASAIRRALDVHKKE